MPGHGQRAGHRGKGSALSVVTYTQDVDEPQPLQIQDTKTFAPLLSPDGTRIVYNQTFGATDIFVMSLEDFEPIKVGHGANPHWWVDSKSGEEHVIYRSDNGGFRGPPPGKTFRQKVGPEGRPAGEPEVIFEVGFGGGLSADGRYLATGFMKLVVGDRETGECTMPLGDGTPEDNHNQTCCVSVAPDESGRYMMLRWPHSHFGICDFQGRWDLKIRCPDDVEEWQTPEWSTHPKFATASCMTRGTNYDLYLIRLSDYEMLRLTTSGGYVHGHLWVGPEVEA
jgi:hypothetical protein